MITADFLSNVRFFKWSTNWKSPGDCKELWGQIPTCSMIYWVNFTGVKHHITHFGVFHAEAGKCYQQPSQLSAGAQQTWCSLCFLAVALSFPVRAPEHSTHLTPRSSLSLPKAGNQNATFHLSPSPRTADFTGWTIPFQPVDNKHLLVCPPTRPNLLQMQVSNIQK